MKTFSRRKRCRIRSRPMPGKPYQWNNWNLEDIKLSSPRSVNSKEIEKEQACFEAPRLLFSKSYWITNGALSCAKRKSKSDYTPEFKKTAMETMRLTFPAKSPAGKISAGDRKPCVWPLCIWNCAPWQKFEKNSFFFQISTMVSVRFSCISPVSLL